jgi:hypothetical protein
MASSSSSSSSSSQSNLSINRAYFGEIRAKWREAKREDIQHAVDVIMQEIGQSGQELVFKGLLPGFSQQLRAHNDVKRAEAEWRQADANLEKAHHIAAQLTALVQKYMDGISIASTEVEQYQNATNLPERNMLIWQSETRLRELHEGLQRLKTDASKGIADIKTFTAEVDKKLTAMKKAHQVHMRSFDVWDEVLKPMLDSRYIFAVGLISILEERYRQF